MDVLLIGSGAREHAIAWKLRQSPRLDALYAAPGNAGIAQIAECVPLAIPNPHAPQVEIDYFLSEVVRIARECRAGLVVVAPDDALAIGAVDVLEAVGIRAFGATKAAAQIEASKSFAKGLMRRHGIPMGATAEFNDFESARAYIESRPVDVVVKADGLIAGKGSVVTESHAEAIDVVRGMLQEGTHGGAGSSVVIEDLLIGRETSAMAFTDGTTVVHMPFSCDHKPVYDGNRGPNTGGMGVYAPNAWLDATMAATIRRDITEAALRAMAAEGTPFRGILYPGIMVTAEGPRVIEFNARLGDPEGEALLPLLDSDVLEIMLACTDGTLDRVDVRWSDAAAVTVFVASHGYPDKYETGKPITGLENIDGDVAVFHSGTKRDASGGWVTNGGRVVAVTATGATLEAAREKAYDNVRRISFEGMHYRTDIGRLGVGEVINA